MSAFYDLASLVVVPSGYKASKVYAQKPLTTDGQLAFTRSTTATRVNSAGLIEASAINVPRLDYLNSSCPRLLLEGQRSNLANWSEQANQYTKVGATIGSNVLASPDGTVNADSIIEDASSGPHAFYNFGLTTFTAAAYTASVFAKKGTRDWVSLSLYDGTTDRQAFFNLATGVAGTVTAGATSTITNYGNGWYRCTITATAAATAGGIAVYAANVNGSATYAGVNGATAIYAYGWQLELGAYATSYIPTLGAAVTRGADACSKTGISSLIGQTEGTLFAEFDFVSGETANYALLHQAAFSTYIFINQGVSGTIFGQIQPFGVSFSAAKPNGRYKCALAYKSGDSAFFVNGVQVGTTNTTTFTPVAMDILNFTADPHTNSNHQALLFPTRLSNADLAALTA